MDDTIRRALNSQFGAALAMFEASIKACPEDLWQARLWRDDGMPAGFSEFWYVAYHTLFWLDLYLSGMVEGFTPPAPFTLDELDPAGVLPERVYAKAELLAYLDHCRAKAHTVILELTDEGAQRQCRFSWGELTFFELLLDNLRHVQEHGAQLALTLGRERGIGNRWKSLGKD